MQAELSVVKIGGSSITVAIRLLGADGAPRVRATLILVLMDMKMQRATHIPEPIGSRIVQFWGVAAD